MPLAMAVFIVSTTSASEAPSSSEPSSVPTYFTGQPTESMPTQGPTNSNPTAEPTHAPTTSPSTPLPTYVPTTSGPTTSPTTHSFGNPLVVLFSVPLSSLSTSDEAAFISGARQALLNRVSEFRYTLTINDFDVLLEAINPNELSASFRFTENVQLPYNLISALDIDWNPLVVQAGRSTYQSQITLTTASPEAVDDDWVPSDVLLVILAAFLIALALVLFVILMNKGSNDARQRQRKSQYDATADDVNFTSNQAHFYPPQDHVQPTSSRLNTQRSSSENYYIDPSAFAT